MSSAEFEGLPVDVLDALAELPRHRFERHEAAARFVCSPPEIVRLTGEPALSLRPAGYCPGCGLVVDDEEVHRTLDPDGHVGDLELNLVVLLRRRR